MAVLPHQPPRPTSGRNCVGKPDPLNAHRDGSDEWNNPQDFAMNGIALASCLMNIFRKHWAINDAEPLYYRRMGIGGWAANR